jgi:hypothetical protein
MRQVAAEVLATLPQGIPYFHATDCFGGREDFDGMDIPDRVRLLDTITDLILEARDISGSRNVHHAPAVRTWYRNHPEG